MQKQIINTWKMIIKTKHHHILKKNLHHKRCKKFVWMGNVLKLPADVFKWKKKNTSEFNESFIKNYDEDSDKEYIFEVEIKYPKRLHNLNCDLPFVPERMKINRCSQLLYNLYDKKLCGSHKSFKASYKLWTSF